MEKVEAASKAYESQYSYVRRLVANHFEAEGKPDHVLTMTRYFSTKAHMIPERCIQMIGFIVSYSFHTESSFLQHELLHTSKSPSLLNKQLLTHSAIKTSIRYQEYCPMMF